MKTSFVELDTGEQEFFDNPYDAFKFAKRCEAKRKNSVELVAISGSYDTSTSQEDLLMLMAQVNVYRGQQLRYLIRTLDNVTGWLKSQLEQQKDAEDSD